MTNKFSKLREAYQETEFPVLPILRNGIGTGPSIFSVDPGVTTGWAFIAPWDFEVGTIPQDHVGEHLSFLLKKFHPDIVVIEKMPTFMPWMPIALKIAARCEEAIKEYVNPFKTDDPPGGYYKIGPGEWKPVTNKEELPIRMKTQHEKDAYRMGLFYLYKIGVRSRSKDKLNG
jgi:hypothetical protein